MAQSRPVGDVFVKRPQRASPRTWTPHRRGDRRLRSCLDGVGVVWLPSGRHRPTGCVRDAAVALRRLYVPPCGAETVTKYWLPEPVTDPPAPSWPIVSVQPFRVPASPDDRFAQGRDPRETSSIAVRIVAAAVVQCPMAVPSGATSSTVRSPIRMRDVHRGDRRGGVP